MAAQLKAQGDVNVELRPGGLGELRVEVDGADAYSSRRFWFPRANTVLDAVKPRLDPGRPASL